MEKRTGIVLSLISGEVLGKIETSEKAGTHKFSYYTTTNTYTGKRTMVNAFYARLSFSKASFKKANANGERFRTIYHYNFDTYELESL